MGDTACATAVEDCLGVWGSGFGVYRLPFTVCTVYGLRLRIWGVGFQSQRILSRKGFFQQDLLHNLILLVIVKRLCSKCRWR